MMIPIFERKTYLKKPIPLKFIIDFFLFQVPWQIQDDLA